MYAPFISTKNVIHFLFETRNSRRGPFQLCLDGQFLKGFSVILWKLQSALKSAFIQTHVKTIVGPRKISTNFDIRKIPIDPLQTFLYKILTVRLVTNNTCLFIFWGEFCWKHTNGNTSTKKMKIVVIILILIK